MKKENKIIQGLWIGKSLSLMEQLSIKSFLANGHEYHLYVYGKVKNIPNGVIVKNANSIIPKENVFSYKKGVHKKSFGGFSDIFRAKLLYEKGGWYVDTDVTCLKPFDFKEKYLFRFHHTRGCVGNIMKCPKNSKVMLYYYNKLLKEINEQNEDWEKPIQILKESVHFFKLDKFIKNISNIDDLNEIRSFLKENKKIPKGWYAIHRCSEFFRIGLIKLSDIKKENTFLGMINTYFKNPFFKNRSRFKKLQKKELLHFWDKI